MSITKEMLKQALHQLDIQTGDVVYVEADLADVGLWVGKEQMVISALQECIGYEGTIVMPTFTNLASQRGEVEREEWEYVKQEVAYFHKKTSLPESKESLYTQFLLSEGVVRSNHPRFSFAAWGKYAKLICEKHPLHFGLSGESPIGKVCKLQGKTLLLGSKLSNNTALKLFQYEYANSAIEIQSHPIQSKQQVRWVSMLELDFDERIATLLQEVLVEKGYVSQYRLGTGALLMMPLQPAKEVAIGCYQVV
ncbi:MAG: AAC(3) family N-acetyltransferase [Erysipelotrichaceae bacterium]